MSPVFAQHIRWVDVTVDVVERHHSGGNGFSGVVVSKRIVTLGKRGVGHGPALDDGFVIAEEV